MPIGIVNRYDTIVAMSYSNMASTVVRSFWKSTRTVKSVAVEDLCLDLPEVDETRDGHLHRDRSTLEVLRTIPEVLGTNMEVLGAAMWSSELFCQSGLCCWRVSVSVQL